MKVLILGAAGYIGYVGFAITTQQNFSYFWKGFPPRKHLSGLAMKSMDSHVTARKLNYLKQKKVSYCNLDVITFH